MGGGGIKKWVSICSFFLRILISAGRFLGVRLMESEYQAADASYAGRRSDDVLRYHVSLFGRGSHNFEPSMAVSATVFRLFCLRYMHSRIQ